MKEAGILEEAIKAFEAEIGFELEVCAEGKDGPVIDAVLWLKEYPEKPFEVEIKKWAQHKNYGALVYQLKKLNNGLLVADYINPKMAARLKEDGVQFIDCAGNAFINNQKHFVWVRGNKATEEQVDQLAEPKKQTFFRHGTNRAEARLTGATGLKVVYQMLVTPNLVNAPYREIAERAGVALGNIGWVINALKERDIVPRGAKKTNKRIAKPEELIRIFVENYPIKLKPKLELGRFEAGRLADMYLDIDITEYGGVWGGELAAAKQTMYLKPEVWTIYLTDKDQLYTLVGQNRLKKIDKKHRKGPVVEIYQAFWPEIKFLDRPDEYFPMYTDPVLTYADLIATGDPRNIETADILMPKIMERFK